MQKKEAKRNANKGEQPATKREKGVQGQTNVTKTKKVLEQQKGTGKNSRRR